MERSGLEIINLTLEPIAAIELAIREVADAEPCHGETSVPARRILP